MVDENSKRKIENAVRTIRMHFDVINQAISPNNVNPQFRRARSELSSLEYAISDLERLIRNIR